MCSALHMWILSNVLWLLFLAGVEWILHGELINEADDHNVSKFISFNQHPKGNLNLFKIVIKILKLWNEIYSKCKDEIAYVWYVWTLCCISLWKCESTI